MSTPACTVDSHRAAVADDSQWSAFKRVAIWVLGGQKHDVRNCPLCDSSFDRLVPRPASQELQFIPIISARDITLERARRLFASVEAELAVAL